MSRASLRLRRWQLSRFCKVNTARTFDMSVVGKTRVLSSVGIRSDEVTLTLWMSALFAVTQASHGVGANTADALFFLRYGVEDLPLMILLSGPAVMVAIIAQSAGLARQGPRRWLVRLMAVTSAWAAVLWGGVFLDTDAVYPVIWISTQVVIFLTITILWNAAGAACTTRQAKRLFPVFATAAVAGGVVGNLLVGPLAALLGTENLLLVQSLLLLAASALVRRVVLFFGDEHEGRRSMSDEVRRAVSSVRSSRLLKLAAVVVFLLFGLFFLVMFPFSEAVTGQFSSEAEVAGFLGLFSSLATAATFLFSLFVTGRLFSRFGLVMTLMIVPVVYLLGFSIWLVGFGLITASLVRGMQWIAVNSVQTTAYSALFNVLSTARRGPVIALMTAVPAQLGTMAAGGILLVAEGRWSPSQFFVVAFVLAALAVAVVVAMRPAYVSAVVAAVRRGLVGIWEAPSRGIVNPIDRDAVRVLEEHLSDPLPRARAMAAAGLGRMGDQGAIDRVQALLDDDDPIVRAAAFESVCQIEPSMVEPYLAVALADESAEVRLNAVHYLVSTGHEGMGAGSLAPVLHDPDPRVRAASAWLAGGTAGRAVVDDLVAAGDVASLRAVLEEIAMAGREPMGVIPESHIDHEAAGVRVAAIAAHTAVGGRPVPLLPYLDDKSLRVRRTAARSLATTEEGRGLLISVLHEGSVLAAEAALHALTPIEDADASFTDWATKEATRASYLAGHLSVLKGQLDSPSGQYLVRVLGGRVDRLIQWVLVAMTTSRTSDIMPVVARGVGSEDPETKEQAVEALESVGEHSVLKVLLPLLEPTGSGDETRDCRDSLEQLASDFDPWLSALAARCLTREFRDASDVESAGDSPNGASVASLAIMASDHVDTLDEMGRMLVLQSVPMFSDLDPEDLLLVARSTTELRYDVNEIVYREAEPGTQLLVIIDGSAVISRTRDGVRNVVDTYGEGDHVGELSLLTGGQRSADVHAGDDGLHGLAVSKAELVSVLEDRPSVAMGMLGTLASRLINQT